MSGNQLTFAPRNQTKGYEDKTMDHGTVAAANGFTGTDAGGVSGGGGA